MNSNAMRNLNRIKENVSEIGAKIKHIRRKSSGEQKISEFVRDVARKVGFTTRYMTGRDLNTMTRDAVRTCRRYPVQSLATALTLGFLVGRVRRG